jgi:syntaxin 1B/2/3
VQGRHEAIQKIEQQVIELAQLFQDMNELVVQQEAVVQQIDHDADQVHQNVVAGNEQLGTAVTTAYATRRKKWICLGISSTSLRARIGTMHADRPSQSSSSSFSPESSPLR